MSSGAPVVGITVHAAELPSKDGYPDWRYSVSARYAAAVAEAGGVPLLVPTHPAAAGQVGAVLDALSALLVSGGGSIPGQYFLDNPDPTLRQTNPPRYDLEVELVRAAWARGMPLLGICRGHQTISEALGGAPVLNLGQVPGSRNHYQTEAHTVSTHTAEVTPGTRLAGWVGTHLRVNSFHRQVVVEPPAGWVVSARSDDGWVEAIEATEATGGFGVGIQFHPEWLELVEPRFGAVFRDFVAAAREYGEGRGVAREA